MCVHEALVAGVLRKSKGELSYIVPHISVLNIQKITPSTFSYPSLEQLAKLLFGSRHNPRTTSVCPFTTLTILPFLHNRIVLSADPVAISVSERTRTAHTAPPWPFRICCVSPFFQTRAVLHQQSEILSDGSTNPGNAYLSQDPETITSQ